MSVKALRHYHRVGLLEPADVDPTTGYRYYTTEQIPTAQVIRRFRQLDMPLEDISAVLAAADPQARNELIARHLDRLEDGLARTQSAVASLRELLRSPSGSAAIEVEHRTVGACASVAIGAVVDLLDLLPWFKGALGELYATLAAQKVPVAGPAGGIYATELFADERGQATLYVPCIDPVRPTGRVAPMVVPAAELATTVHAGSYADLDRAYGTLASYVAKHALAVDGPIREYYLVGPHNTADESLWRTQVGWPIFQTVESTRPD